MPAAVPAPSRAGALATEIAAARAEARFEDALAAATERERILADAGIRDWRRADAKRDITTLRRLHALPDTARTRWRLAWTETRRAHAERVANPAAAATAHTHWIEICTRWLGPESPEVASALADLADVSDGENNLVRAWELDTRALAMRERALGPRHPEVAASLARMGYNVKRARGGVDLALEYCERALAMQRELLAPGSREIAVSLLLRANIFRLRGAIPRALADFAEAESIFVRTDGDSSLAVAETLGDLGLTLGREARWAEAEPVLRRALALRRRHGGAADPTLALATNQLGVALRELRRYDEAETALREAAAIQEERWRIAAPKSPRAAIFQMAAYQDLAFLELARERWTDAWVALEHLSSRVAVDVAIARGDVDAQDPWADLLLRVQRALPDSAALIGWLDSRYGGKAAEYPFWCYVVRKHGEPRWFHVAKPAGDQPSLRMTIQPLVAAMQAESEWPLRVPDDAVIERMGRVVYQLRMAPMEPALAGVRTLIITSPDMNYGAPVESLIDGDGRFVAERYVTLYAPSALLYAVARERRSTCPHPRDWKALLVGDPSAEGVAGSVWASLPDLPGAARELRSIAARLREADVFVGARASEAVLDSLRRCGRLAEYDLVHFATHAEHDSRWLDGGTLLLAEAPARTAEAPFRAEIAVDGRLIADEIGTTWRLDARIVSLAACRGFAHVFSIGEGAQGIGLAFLGAGARSVLLNSYAVDDQASRLFFARFTELLFARPDAAPNLPAALREARLWLRAYRAPDGSQPYASPAFWSGFVLVGWPG